MKKSLTSKVCSCCKKNKPLDQFYKESRGAGGVGSICKACSKLKKQAWHKKNYVKALPRLPKTEEEKLLCLEAKRLSKKKYRDKNREKINEKYRGKPITQKQKDWAKANQEKIQFYKKKWKLENPHRSALDSKRRYRFKKLAIPPWANTEWENFLMSETYRLAKDRSKTTGFKWHVDHRVPLVSNLVCGLHCSANLAVIPAVTNLSKSNLFWENMP